MNSSLDTACHSRPQRCLPDEPIDVCRIRLMQSAGACAVVSEFRAADQVLDRWIGRGAGAPARRDFTFEITFVDGYTLRGCYEFWRSARRRPRLARCVHSLFGALATPPAADLSRYAIDTP
jgi:hypothetical protein